MRFKETKGHLPFMKAKVHDRPVEHLSHSPSSSDHDGKSAEKASEAVKVMPTQNASVE